MKKILFILMNIWLSSCMSTTNIYNEGESDVNYMKLLIQESIDELVEDTNTNSDSVYMHYVTTR